MAGLFSTNTPADDVFRAAVWAKGRPIPNFDPNVWRHDIYGSVMKYQEYGNRLSEHGWEFDHIVRVRDGGSDDVSNLRPLNWKNNASRG